MFLGVDIIWRLDQRSENNVPRIPIMVFTVVEAPGGSNQQSSKRTIFGRNRFGSRTLAYRLTFSSFLMTELVGPAYASSSLHPLGPSGKTVAMN